MYGNLSRFLMHFGFLIKLVSPFKLQNSSMHFFIYGGINPKKTGGQFGLSPLLTVVFQKYIFRDNVKPCFFVHKSQFGQFGQIDRPRKNYP